MRLKRWEEGGGERRFNWFVEVKLTNECVTN